MKLSGGILVLVSVIFTGVTISLRLKKRVDFLSQTVMLISQISMEIEYAGLPLAEIFKKLSRESCCSCLDFIPLCIENYEKGDSFSSSFQGAVEASQLPMKKEEALKLKAMGSMLGTSDARGQKQLLSLYSSYFTSYCEGAVKEYEKYGKLCVTLSVVLGTGIMILLI